MVPYAGPFFIARLIFLADPFFLVSPWCRYGLSCTDWSGCTGGGGGCTLGSYVGTTWHILISLYEWVHTCTVVWIYAIHDTHSHILAFEYICTLTPNRHSAKEPHVSDYKVFNLVSDFTKIILSQDRPVIPLIIAWNQNVNNKHRNQWETIKASLFIISTPGVPIQCWMWNVNVEYIISIL